MKADKREIVTFVIAALATLVAVWFFLGKMQKEKDTVRTDLYTLVAPASDAILSVNRPAAFTKYILSRDSERDAFEIGRASCREKCRSRWSPYH